MKLVRSLVGRSGLCRTAVRSCTSNSQQVTNLDNDGKSTNQLRVQQQPGQSFDLDAVLQEKQKLLFTPGPLSSSLRVKSAMLKDFGSRDETFINLVKSLRQDILDAANLSNQQYTSILMQGAGTFAVESVLQSVIPSNGRLLVLSNGSYGKRAYQIACGYLCESHVDTLPCDELHQPDMEAVRAQLLSQEYSHVFMVHSETTQGILNPLSSLRKCIYDVYTRKDAPRAGRPVPSLIVDAMSSFGGYEIDLDGSDAEMSNIDYLVTSANKCLQGVPGFGIILARIDCLHELCNLREQGLQSATSLSLDLYEQWAQLEKTSEFRFTPPTHTMFALKAAMNELFEEGGIPARAERYEINKQVVWDGMKRLGFELLLQEEIAGHIITSFKYPESPNWNFETFYQRLSDRGFVTYTGKVSMVGCFRIGHIGDLSPKDSAELIEAAGEICRDMKL